MLGFVGSDTIRCVQAGAKQRVVEGIYCVDGLTREAPTAQAYGVDPLDSERLLATEREGRNVFHDA